MAKKRKAAAAPICRQYDEFFEDGDTSKTCRYHVSTNDAVSSAKKQKVRKLTHFRVGSDHDRHLIAPTPVMEVLSDTKLKEKITKDVSNEHASHKLSRFQQRFQASDHR
ncbi:hypothetical protein QR685DRAFT_578776 [Neurospora intermedia]|uniref:Uncharacterized protein n=1 Tax=Neurospora intermedia TaxID=5142 RepID=A0ABR3DT61_NEUIN